MLEKYRKLKEELYVKLDQASLIADKAADDFIEQMKSLVKESSEDEIMELLKSDDEIIDDQDKLAIVAAFAESHKGVVIMSNISPEDLGLKPKENHKEN